MSGYVTWGDRIRVIDELFEADMSALRLERDMARTEAARALVEVEALRAEHSELFREAIRGQREANAALLSVIGERDEALKTIAHLEANAIEHEEHCAWMD